MLDVCLLASGCALGFARTDCCLKASESLGREWRGESLPA